jgi:hypothetical protein
LAVWAGIHYCICFPKTHTSRSWNPASAVAGLAGEEGEGFFKMAILIVSVLFGTLTRGTKVICFVEGNMNPLERFEELADFGGVFHLGSFQLHWRSIAFTTTIRTFNFKKKFFERSSFGD